MEHGREDERMKAFSLQIGRGKRSCHTKRGEKGKREEGRKESWLEEPSQRNATTCC